MRKRFNGLPKRHWRSATMRDASSRHRREREATNRTLKVVPAVPRLLRHSVMRFRPTGKAGNRVHQTRTHELPISRPHAGNTLELLENDPPRLFDVINIIVIGCVSRAPQLDTLGVAGSSNVEALVIHKPSCVQVQSTSCR